MSQADKIMGTLVLTCLLPLGLHALPISSATGLGQMWLPMFYAPLIASLCFCAHVPILAGLLAPTINHFFFGMPNDQVLVPLTFELVLMSVVILFIRRWMQPLGWMVGLAYAGTLFVTLIIFSYKHDMVSLFVRGIRTAIPGILLLVAVTEIVRRMNKRHEV